MSDLPWNTRYCAQHTKYQQISGFLWLITQSSMEVCKLGSRWCFSRSEVLTDSEVHVAALPEMAALLWLIERTLICLFWSMYSCLLRIKYKLNCHVVCSITYFTPKLTAIHRLSLKSKPIEPQNNVFPRYTLIYIIRKWKNLICNIIGVYMIKTYNLNVLTANIFVSDLSKPPVA